jgi:hypothetical protein
MYREEHLRVMTEVRALTYEADALKRTGGEQALGMFAVAQALDELCHSEIAPDELLAEHVNARLLELQEYIAGSEDLRHAMAIEQGERTRSYPLPYEELVQLVDVASSNAYFTHACVSGIRQNNARQHPGSCSTMFYLMQHELRKMEVEAQHMWWYEAGNNHHFLRTLMPNGDVILIDPTWQQYLPDGTDYSEHPNVLIMPDDKVGEILSHHGVPEPLHRTWLAAKVDPRPETNQWYWSRELTQAFESDPWIPSLPTNKQRFYALSE